jgi:hypothetical protein
MLFRRPGPALATLVRCIRGALYDVILDLRKESATFGKSFGAELTADNRRMVYVPKGVAHGFITLAELVQEHLDTDLRPMGGRRVKRRLSQDLKRGVSRPQFGIHRAMLSRCAFCQASHRALGHAQADFSSETVRESAIRQVCGTKRKHL